MLPFGTEVYVLYKNNIIKSNIISCRLCMGYEGEHEYYNTITYSINTKDVPENESENTLGIFYDMCLNITIDDEFVFLKQEDAEEAKLNASIKH